MSFHIRQPELPLSASIWGENSSHIVGQDGRGEIVLRQKWSRSQVEARFANMSPCLIGMEACVGAHHLSRQFGALGHDARLISRKHKVVHISQSKFLFLE